MSGKKSKEAKLYQALKKDQPNYGKYVFIVAIVLAVIATAVGLFVLSRSSGTTSGADQATANRVVSALTSIPSSTLDKVGLGTTQNTLRKTSGDLLLGEGGKPEIFYVGAEYCPYCASQRWGLIIALSRFGTFSGLTLTTSSGVDIFPNTHTFSFYKSKFTSDFLDFVAVEQYGKIPLPSGGYNQLQSLTAEQKALIDQYDTGGGIPFTDFANQYVISGATVKPDVISGLNWDEIVNKLKDPSTSQAKAILGSANLITAAICKITKEQPASVCSSQSIQSLEKELP